MQLQTHTFIYLLAISPASDLATPVGSATPELESLCTYCHELRQGTQTHFDMIDSYRLDISRNATNPTNE